MVFTVDSKDGDGQNGVGGLRGRHSGDLRRADSRTAATGNFAATVTTTETPTDEECKTENNTNSATATDAGVIASVPKTDVRIGTAAEADPICVPEDSNGVAIPVEGSTTAGSHLTSIVITGFPTGAAAVGWTFNFAGLDTGSNVSVDKSQLAASAR